MVGDGQGGFFKIIQQSPPVKIEDDYPSFGALLAQDRRSHAQHGFVGHINLVVFDIQVERGNKNFVGLELDCVGEKIALPFVLKLLRLDDDRLAFDNINTGYFHAGFINPSHLVVDALSLGEDGEVLGQLADIGRRGRINSLSQRAVMGEKSKILGDGFHFMRHRAGTEAQVQRFITEKARPAALDMALTEKQDSNDHQKTKWQEQAEEKELPIYQGHALNCSCWGR